MALDVNGRICLFTFMAGTCICSLPWLAHINSGLEYVVTDLLPFLLGGYIAILNGILMVVYRGPAYQNAVRGCLLGVVFGIGVMLTLSQSTFRLFGWYLASLAFFHWSEYFSTAVTNPGSLSIDSYLLDHSREYHIAAVASVVEFTVEWFLFPGLKSPGWLNLVGLLMVAAGEAMRKLAMVTASTNFNHYVQHIKAEGHVLVTHGVYAWCRHPSYVGWFYWSIGTQVMIFNPVCLVGYTWASWKFFNQRIIAEEIALLNFFGEEYIDYQKKVKTGLPLIKGYRLEL